MKAIASLLIGLTIFAALVCVIVSVDPIYFLFLAMIVSAPLVLFCIYLLGDAVRRRIAVRCCRWWHR